MQGEEECIEQVCVRREVPTKREQMEGISGQEQHSVRTVVSFSR